MRIGRLRAFGFGAALGVLAALAGCATLPPGALVKSPGAKTTAAATPVGADQVGEPCAFSQNEGPSADVPSVRAVSLRCGTWQQPSGHVYEASSGESGASLDALVRSGPWRAHLDQFLTCAAPRDTRILDGVPAALLQCSRRNGGWPHLAFAAKVGDRTFLADGVLSALPALEATVAALTGREVAGGGRHRSAAFELMASELARQPFGSGDLERYYGLMKLGDEANSIDNFAAAEDAFRDALAVQQRILGPNNPGLALPLMHLGLQISNQHRFAEADGFFKRAAALLAAKPDPLVEGRLELYLGMHEANQDNFTAAAEHTAEAERIFAAQVPPATLAAARRGETGASRGAPDTYDSLFFDLDTETGILGLSNVWRFQGMLAYRKHKYELASRLAQQAETLVKISGLGTKATLPRVVRVAALTEQAQGRINQAVTGLSDSVRLFSQYAPNERPVAVTLFLIGRALEREGRTDAALERFRRGAKILTERHLGLPESFITPYLDTLYAAAKANPREAEKLDAEMSEASQFVQSSLTAQFIAKAAARLASGDQRVSAALRELQDDELALKNLFVERDAEAQKPEQLQNADELARIDAKIAAAEAKRNDAEAAAQAAAPAYGQLVQANASAESVMRLLGPDEALFDIQLGREHSYGFLVTPRKVVAYRLALTLEQATAAVDRLRKTAQVFFTADGQPRIPIYDIAEANALYRTLFGPIGPALAGVKHLVIAPSGPLLSLPFEMLVTAPTPAVTNGDYRTVPFLLKRFAVAYVPAPQTFVGLRQIKAPSAAPLPFIGFGDFQPASKAQLAKAFPPDRCKEDYEALSELPKLPGTREEVLGIGKLLGARPEDILLGPAFTRAAVEKIDFRQYRVIHFATHAFLPSELHCKSEPSILMSVPPTAASAADAFLEGSEVLHLKMDADLVVLSACNTAGPGGAGSGGSGESLSGLARDFFFAGTRGLLVTHWEVDDDSADYITTRTMETMRPGSGERDTVDALRQAKLDRIAGKGVTPGSGTLFSHPFAWAPFVLIGDGLRVPPAAS